MNHVVQQGDDAVLEVELSQQDLQAIAQTRSPTRTSEKAAAKAAARKFSPAITVGLGAASVVAVAALFLANRGPDFKPPLPPGPVDSLPVAAVMAPAANPEPAALPVKFANPFDKKEVFEFPAGTSPAEAREKVAELLLKRAQERRPALRRVASR